MKEGLLGGKLLSEDERPPPVLSEGCGDGRHHPGALARQCPPDHRTCRHASSSVVRVRASSLWLSRVCLCSRYSSGGEAAAPWASVQECSLTKRGGYVVPRLRLSQSRIAYPTTAMTTMMQMINTIPYIASHILSATDGCLVDV